MTTPASSNGNPWFASTVGLAGLIVGYVIASGVQTFDGSTMGAFNAPAAVPGAAQPAAAPVPPAPAATDTPATAGDGPFLGKASAPVTLIEFTDYQCPFCQRHFQQTFPDIKKNYVDSGKVKYVPRHFPLGFHPNATKASETVACAADQGKFEEMHAKIFETQGDWSGLDSVAVIAKFKEYAKEVGVNAAAFATCLDTGSKTAMVQADQAAGSASGIDGTPGFWILGPDGQSKKISGAYPYATFQAAIDEMLN